MKNFKLGTPDGVRGGHLRLKLTGNTLVRGVVTEAKAREICADRAEKRANRRTGE